MLRSGSTMLPCQPVSGQPRLLAHCTYIELWYHVLEQLHVLCLSFDTDLLVAISKINCIYSVEDFGAEYLNMYEEPSSLDRSILSSRFLWKVASQTRETFAILKITHNGRRKSLSQQALITGPGKSWYDDRDEDDILDEENYFSFTPLSRKRQSRSWRSKSGCDVCQ